MWRFIFVSSVEITEIFSLLFLAAAAITHICTNENGQTHTSKTPLAFWQKWGDEMIWEISHRGHHFQGQLSISRHRLSGPALRSHSSDNWMDAKLKKDFSFLLFRKCYSAQMVQKKSHSHSAEQWWKCHHLLSLNLTWGDVSKMVACPAPWWAGGGPFFTISFLNADLDGVPPGPPLGLTFILGRFLVATPPPVGQTSCDGSNP